MEEVIRDGALRLLTSETSCDVILSCHGHRMMAHKVILSIASPLLRDLLLQDTSQPTVLIFPDISGSTMSLILDYIYTGTVAVPPVVLSEFLNIANLLKLKLDNEYLLKHATYLPHHQPKPNDVHNTAPRTVDGDLEDDKQTKDIVTVEDIKAKHEKPSNFTLNYLDSDGPNVRCKRGRKMPSLMPLTTLKRRRELFNKVFPSPWCPRGSPVLKHPREDCHIPSPELPFYSPVAAQPLFQPQPPFKELLHQNDSNNNNSNYSLHYPYESPTNSVYYNDTSALQQQLLIKTITPVSPGGLVAIEELCHKSNKNNSSCNSLKNNNCQLPKVPIVVTTTDPELVSDAVESKEAPQIRADEDCESVAASKAEEDDCKNDKLKPFKCEECGKGFSQLRNYKYHRSIHEGTKEFAARCPECGKTFNDKGYLSSHMKIHRDKKEYACPHCPKRFNQRVAYNMHLRIHTGVKPHECPTCGKSFSRKMLLKQHQRVHTGERPYTCPECGKSFADRSNMSLHARLHTGIKPYACTLCPKSFTKKHHLKTHMNFHTGLKPYSCQNCGLSFSQSSNMRTHYKKCILKDNPNDNNVQMTNQ